MNKLEKNNKIRPASVPNKNLGQKLSVKVAIRKDYIRKTDGKSQLYIDASYGGKRKKIYLNLYVKPKFFSSKKQRILKSEKNSRDANILIEKKIALLYAIELDYRLKGKFLSIDQLMNEFYNPTQNTDFLLFWEKELEKEKLLLKKNTYKQQKSSLKLIREFSNHIYFSQINDDLIKEMISFFKKRQNKISTINVHLKNFKKFLHLANKKGILTELTFDQIKVKHPDTPKTFLTKNEISKLNDFYNSSFIAERQRNILQRFLFSCFTGLRISDVQKISRQNLSDNILFLTSTKTNKIQRIPLSNSALNYINKKGGNLFTGKYSDQAINRILKEIAYQTGINKKLTFHVARHTFATQWLINGGDVVNLQKMLGHSKIKETMVYVHLIDAITESQIHLLDKILD